MEALSVVASVIAVVGAISSSYETIDKIKDLPKAFDKVNQNLPLVQKILNDTQKRLQAAQKLSDDDENVQLILQAVQQCQEKATVLKKIFDKLEAKCRDGRDADKTWPKARAWYREVLQGIKAHRVETLMMDIMERVKTLAMNELLSLHDDIDDIKSALAELSDIEPSLEDSEFETGVIQATQVNESGAHGQQNNTQGGSHVFNSGNNISGNSHTITLDRIDKFYYLASSPLEHRQLPSSIQTESGQTRLAQSPMRHYIPFPRNNRFIGRVDTLNELQAMLQTEGRVALVGMGGIGKTETALKIAYWVRDNLPSCSVFWVSAVSEKAFESSCEKIIEKLALPPMNAVDSKLMLRRYLGSDNAGSWLLIVDNLDDMKLLGWLFNYLPQNDNGHTLFTTRSAEVGRTVAGGNQHALSEMNETDAGDLFTGLLPQNQHDKNPTEALCLVKELDCIPLAIKHAAAYIERNRVSVAEYRNLMKSSEPEFVNLMSREFAQINESGVRFTSIATTWLVSFEQIAKDDPPAARILGFISQIEPKAIPRSILPDDKGRERLSHALGTLLGYAFITKQKVGDVYDMHSLVHLAARLWIERKGRLQSCVTDLLAHLSGVFSLKNDSHDRHWREFAPHLLRLSGAIDEDHFQAPQILSLGLAIATSLFLDDRVHEAADLYQHILEKVDSVSFTSEEDDQVYRTSVIVALKCYVDTQRHRKAIELAKNVLEGRKFASLAEKTYLCRMHIFLAKAYQKAGQEDESLAVVDQACQRMPRIETVEQAELAMIQCEIASIYMELGRFSTATDMFQRLVAAWDNSGRKNHNVVIKAQSFLAKISVENKCPKDAIEILESFWEVARQANAEADDEVLSSQRHLATLLLCDSQPGRAIKICEVILGIFERSGRRPMPTEYLETQTTMAVAYAMEGELLKASKLFEKILEADPRLCNDQNRALLRSELELGMLYHSQGRKDEGIRIMRSVADLRKRVLGEDHELTLYAMNIVYRYERL